MKQIFTGSNQKEQLIKVYKRSTTTPIVVLLVMALILIVGPIVANKSIFNPKSGLSNVAIVFTENGSQGSATYIGNGLLLTAAHVVDGVVDCMIFFNDPNNLSDADNAQFSDDGNSLTLSDYKGKKMAVACMAKVIAKGNYGMGNDPAEDFALLKISNNINADKHTSACKLAQSARVKFDGKGVGPSVTVIGYPGGRYSPTPGQIIQLDMDGNTSIFVTQAKAWRGNSGGALKDKNDNLIGVITSIGNNNQHNDDQTYAIKIDYIKSRLSTMGYSI